MNPLLPRKLCIALLAAVSMAACKGYVITIPLDYSVALPGLTSPPAAPPLEEVLLSANTLSPFGPEILFTEYASLDGTFSIAIAGHEIPGSARTSLTDGIPGSLFFGIEALGERNNFGIPDFDLRGGMDLFGLRISDVFMNGLVSSSAGSYDNGTATFPARILRFEGTFSIHAAPDGGATGHGIPEPGVTGLLAALALLAGVALRLLRNRQ